MRFLLDKGADINAQTISGRTPLMYAVQFAHVNLVIMLLGRRELMVEASDLEGFTALIIAIEMGEPGAYIDASFTSLMNDPFPTRSVISSQLFFIRVGSGPGPPAGKC